MKILFTGPRDIFATPALDRALYATKELRSETILVDWNEKEDVIGEKISEFHFRKSKSILTLIIWQFFLFGKIFKHKPDVIFNMSVLSSVPIFLYTFIYRKRSIYDCRDYLAVSYKFNLIIEFIIRFIDNIYGFFSSGIVVPDEYGIKYFFLVKKSKITVVYNTVKDYGIRKKFSDGPVRIAYLGYLSYDRNIKAIFEYVKKNPDIELHIAINYLSQKLKDVIPNLDNIILHERLGHKDAQELLRKMDYCLLMYNPELGNYKYIQPTKFYDCLALGLPFICSKGNVKLEEHIKGTANIAVEYDSTDFPKLHKTKFSQYNHSLYEEKYSYDLILDNYRKSMEIILKDKRR